MMMAAWGGLLMGFTPSKASPLDGFDSHLAKYYETPQEAKAACAEVLRYMNYNEVTHANKFQLCSNNFVLSPGIYTLPWEQSGQTTGLVDCDGSDNGTGITVYGCPSSDSYFALKFGYNNCGKGYWGIATSQTGGQCVPIVDVYDDPPPESCEKNPGYGKPIRPLTGSETFAQFIDGGLGRDVFFKYNSINKLTGRSQAVSNDLGGLWGSSLHRRLIIGAGSKSIQALRSNGVKSFLKNSTGKWILSSTGQDALSLIDGGDLLYRDQESLWLETYDGNGRLKGFISSSGALHGAAYTGDNMIGLSDQFGRQIGFTYKTVAGAVVLGSFKDARGYSTVVGYDSATGNLNSIAWPDQNVRSFIYDSPNLNQQWAFTGVVDEINKRHFTIGYDGNGFARSSTLAGGVGRYSVEYSSFPELMIREVYDSSANVVYRYHEWAAPAGVVIAMPDGNARTLDAAVIGSQSHLNKGSPRSAGISQPEGAGCNASISYQGYDAYGNFKFRNDFNRKRTCYSHTTSIEGVVNLEKVRVEGLSATAECNSVVAEGVSMPVGARKISTKWHLDWALKIEQAEPRLKTTWVYNGQANPFNDGQPLNCVSLMYGHGSLSLPDGKPTAVVCKKVEQATLDTDGSQGLSPALDPSTESVVRREWSYTYNQYGQMLTSTDPRGQVTKYEYYQSTSFTGADPNAVGHYQGDLWKVSIMSAASPTTALYTQAEYTSYDKAGRVLSMKDANGLVTSYTYTPRGWLSSETRGNLKTAYDYWPTGLLKKVTQPDQSYLYYQYDDAHRLTDISDKVDASGTPTGNRVHYTLDNAGNRKNEEVRDTSGALKRNITRTYDALNRLHTVTGPQQ